MSYRRVEVQGPGQVLLVERDEPEMRPACARVQVAYCSVNRADVERVKGAYGGVDIAGAAFASVAGTTVPGYEPVGTVIELAEDADPSLLGATVMLHSHTSCGKCDYCTNGLDNLCAGMRVFGSATPGMGGWSEQIVVPVSQLLVLPQGVDPRFACTYEVTYGTALWNLRRGLELAARPGPIVVRGVPGGVALAALQLCQVLGLPAGGVMRDPGGPRAEAVRAELPGVVLFGEADLAKAVERDLGSAPSVVVEPLGGDYVASDLDLVAHGGAVGVVGGHIGAIASVRLDVLFHKGVSVFGTPRGPIGTMLEVAELVASGRLTPLIDRVFDLASVSEALRYCDQQTGIGRVLLSMGSA